MVRIADAHAHIYPPKIALKATEAIGNFYEIPMDSVGTSDKLLKSGAEIGIEKYIVCSAATTPSQVESINNFIYSEAQNHPEFVPLATMHKDYENFSAELERIKNLGFYGVKFHNDFQKFNVDDEGVMPIYEKCLELNLVILFHMGDARYEFTKPERLCNVIRTFPKLKCQAAHFGGYQDWERGFIAYPKLFSEGLGENLYFDTSSTLFKLDSREATNIINRFGEDRFLFGCDFPMWKHKEELERFNRLDLTDAQRYKILFGNFEKLYIKKEKNYE